MNNLDFIFKETAESLGVEEAAIRAVCHVESDGRTGFLPDGRPMILFEGHIFWRELQLAGIDPAKFGPEYADVLYPRWDKSKYKGGAAEYERLEKAATIDLQAAMRSASWGMFQIMGFNHILCGFDTVNQFALAMRSGSHEHIRAFAKFLKGTMLDRHLQARDWTEFARHYNGPSYAQNRYDSKLAAAYKEYLA